MCMWRCNISLSRTIPLLCRWHPAVYKYINICAYFWQHGYHVSQRNHSFITSSSVPCLWWHDIFDFLREEATRGRLWTFHFVCVSKENMFSSLVTLTLVHLLSKCANNYNNNYKQWIALMWHILKSSTHFIHKIHLMRPECTVSYYQINATLWLNVGIDV